MNEHKNPCIYLEISSGSILELTRRKQMPNIPLVLTMLISKSYDNFLMVLMCW